MELKAFRAKYPQYNDLDDRTLAQSLHQRHYSDIAFPDFAKAIGYSEPGDTSRGFQTAIGQTVPLAKGAVGLAGATVEKVFGEGGAATAVKEWGLRGYEEGMKKLEPLALENDDVTVAWGKAKEGDVGALVDWAQYALGYGAAQIGETVAVAIAGGFAGGAIGGGGAAPGAAAGVLAKQATKGMIRSAIDAQIAKRAGAFVERGAAQDVAQREAAKSLARDIGAGTALVGYNVTQEAGSIYPEAVEQAHKEGRELTGSDLARIYGATALAAGSETATDLLGLGAVAGKLGIKGTTRLRRAGTGAAVGPPIEAGQEAFQTAAERWGARKDLTGDEATNEYINAAAMGALPGGVVGAVAGALSRGPAAAARRSLADPGAPSDPGIDIARTTESIMSAPTADEAIQRASVAAAPPMRRFELDYGGSLPSLPTDSINDLINEAITPARARSKAATFANIDAGSEAQKDAEINALQNESRLPAALYDVDVDQKRGAIEQPTAMQLAFQRAGIQRPEDFTSMTDAELDLAGRLTRSEDKRQQIDVEVQRRAQEPPPPTIEPGLEPTIAGRPVSKIPGNQLRSLARAGNDQVRAVVAAEYTRRGMDAEGQLPRPESPSAPATAVAPPQEAPVPVQSEPIAAPAEPSATEVQQPAAAPTATPLAAGVVETPALPGAEPAGAAPIGKEPVGRDGLRQADRDMATLRANAEEFTIQTEEESVGDEPIAAADVVAAADRWATEASVNVGAFRRELYGRWRENENEALRKLAPQLVGGVAADVPPLQNENIRSEQKSSIDLAEELSQLRGIKPRPLNKMYGRSPTPEQVTSHAQQMRQWNAKYRRVSKLQKEALERDNRDFRERALDPESALEQTREPGQDDEEREIDGRAGRHLRADREVRQEPGQPSGVVEGTRGDAAPGEQRGGQATARVDRPDAAATNAEVKRKDDRVPPLQASDQLNLVGQTEAEIRAEESRRAALETAQVTGTAIGKQIADAIRDGFALSAPAGSVSADPLASPNNQQDLLSAAPAEQAAPSGEGGAAQSEEPPSNTALSRNAAPIFYSELARQVEALKLNAGPVSQWKSALLNMTQKGVKRDEIEWSGVTDWLDTQQGKVSKDSVVSFLRENGVQVTETMLGRGGGPLSFSWGGVYQAGDHSTQTIGASYGDDGVEHLYAKEDYAGGGRGNGRNVIIQRESGKDGRIIYDGPPLDGPQIQTLVRRDLEERLGLGNEEGEAKFESYTLPGGQNYRELLLTLPDRAREWPDNQLPDHKFRSSHFDQPNIIAHVRFNERTDASGARVLFIEEIQSDWAQKGRRDGFKEAKPLPAATEDQVELRFVKSVVPDGHDPANYPGYWESFDTRDGGFVGRHSGNLTRDRAMREAVQYSHYAAQERAAKGVQRAPFVGKTEAWVSLAMKRMIRYGAENGFDRVAFITGEQSAERYDLSKHIDKLDIERAENDDYMVLGYRGGQVVVDKSTSPDGLADVIGKDLAARAESDINASEQDRVSYTGLDLKVGGEGMKSFYDKIVPGVARDVLKKLGGGTVREIKVATNATGRSDTRVVRDDDGTYAIEVRKRDAEFNDDQYWEPVAFGLTKEDAEAKRIENGIVPSMPQPGFSITPEMREKALSGLPVMSRSGIPGLGMKRADVKAVAEVFRRQLKGLPDVHALQSLNEAPPELVKDIKALGGERDTAGAWHAGEIYLFSDNLRSPEHAGWVLLHEATHHGLRGMFGTALDRTLRDAYIGNAQLRKAVDARRPRDRKLSTVRLVEEQMADWGADGVPQSVWQQLISGVRKILRSLGLSLKTTDGDIRSLIADALRFVNSPQKHTSYTSGTVTFPSESEDTALSRAGTMPDWVTSQPADMQEALRKAGAWRPRQTVQERIVGWTADWQKKLKQGMVDQFDPIKSLDYKAYMLARMSKSSAGALESVLFNGTIHIDKDGAVDVDYEKGGFIGRMQSLKGEHDRFFSWVISNRAKRLLAEGREHNFTEDDIARLKTLNQGKMDDGSSRETTYMKALLDLNRYNKSILDMAEKSGLVDGETRPLYEKDFYIPFYRLTEGDTTKGPVRSSGLVKQYAFKTLLGGPEAIGDPMENILKNWAHQIDASLKNQAAVASLDAAVKIGVAHETNSEEKGAVFVMKNGEKTYYGVDDPFVLDAINSLGFSGFSGPAMKALTSFKRWLTYGVTISPSFRIRNVIRDSLSMIGTNPASYNVLDNVLTGWKLTREGSPTYASMIAGGGVIRFGTFMEGDSAASVKRLVNAGVDSDTILDTPAKVKAMVRAGYDWWMSVGDRSENINRAALYQKLRDEGRSHLEASYAARDTMDFSMMGTWSAIRFLAQTVPFFNARLEGMYKLGRGAVEDPRRFAYVIGATALASMALLLAYKDDEDWKQREAFDRETYWWFKIGDKAFRIPKPFEIGAIGTLAERGLEALVTDDLTGKQFAKRMGAVVGQQLSMNPVPQMFMPMIELWANRDAFTGRPIESMGMNRLSPSERISPYTSAFAQLLGKNGIVSPVQIDHLVNGFFGWLGTHAVATADLALRPVMGLPPKPAARIDEVFVLGDFVRDMPAYQSKYVTDLYDHAKEVQQAMADMRAYQKIGATEKAAEILKDKGDKIRLYSLYTHAEKQLTQINQKIKMVQRRDGDADVKRETLDRLYGQRNRVAKLTEERARATQR